MHHTINTRADLEKFRGTAQFAAIIRGLAGSMTTRVNVAEYPDGYEEDGYEGPSVDPVWEDQEDLSTITRFDFTKAELEAELLALEEA